MKCFQVETINNLGEQIGTKLAKAEEEGAKGDVDASLKYMEEVEELKKLKAQEEVTGTQTIIIFPDYSVIDGFMS